MKIINLGILAHVDAGKTTLTESLLYTSGAIAELGSVDEGTTRTDTMNLERQRGITIQTAVTSFQWEDVKVNIIDTPGHMDFLAEVYRSLSVLDGAVLLVSAKDGIQAQTRILFHALQIMKIPTIFFINKIDQEGIDLPMVYREMKAKLSSEIIVKQKVGQHPHINVTDNDDMEQWDAVIMGNDELLEKYMSGKPFKMSELEQEENRRFQNGTLFPVYHGSAKNNLGIRQLIEVIASKFYSSTPEGQSELCGQVFKIEYSEKRRRFVYVRIYSGTLHLRDVIRISEKEKIKITEMCVPTNGELYSSDTACSGDIVILPNDVLQLNSILGNEILLPQRKFIENPLPMLQTTIAVKKSEQREILLGALTEISDGDPLLKYYVDTTTHEIILSFLGNVQMEVICAILEEKYHVEAEIKEPTVIYMERPLRKAEYTIHIEVPPNPFLKLHLYSDPLVNKYEYYLPFHLVLYDVDTLIMTCLSAMVRLCKVVFYLLVLDMDPGYDVPYCFLPFLFKSKFHVTQYHHFHFWLSKHYVVLAPWNYSDKDNLISMFFQSLKNKINVQDNEELKNKVGKALREEFKEENSEKLFTLSASDIAGYLIEDIIERLKTEEEKYGIICSVIENVDITGLGIMARLINRMELAYGRLAGNSEEKDKQIISLTHLEKLEDIYVAKVRDIVNSEFILDRNEFNNVFYLWKCFDKDGVEAYLKGLLKTEVNKLKFICAMATKWHSTNGSGWRFYPQNYSEYISQNEVYNMIQGFDKSKLNQFTDIEQIKLASFALNYNKNEMDHADEQAALNLISEWKTGKAE